MTTSSAASRRAALIERFAAPGQPSGMGERTVRGVPMRVYMTGPLTLRDIALASTGAADRPFLICRDERWSYAEQARIIAGLAHALVSLPRTQSGKVLKRDLRSAVASELRDG